MRIISADKKAIKELIKESKNSFYVYVLIRPDTNDVFYVGKGKGHRIFAHEQEALQQKGNNSYKLNIIRKTLNQKNKITYGIVDFYIAEEDALDQECKLIKEIGRSNLGSGTLTNLTDGGDGLTGWMDFAKHSRSGRPLSSQPGNLDTMMERAEGVSEDEIIGYLKMEGWGDGEPCYELSEEPPEEIKWIGNNFWQKLRTGYGAKDYLYDYIYGEYKDVILRKINLVEKIDQTFFRREDEFSYIIRLFLREERWISKSEIIDRLIEHIIEFKNIDKKGAERITTYFLEELKQLDKIAQEGSKSKWKTEKKAFQAKCSNLKPSEIVREVESFSKGNKNIYVAFLDQEHSVMKDFTFFPHHFRNGLKIFFRQTIVLTINTYNVSYLKMSSL